MYTYFINNFHVHTFCQRKRNHNSWFILDAKHYTNFCCKVPVDAAIQYITTQVLSRPGFWVREMLKYCQRPFIGKHISTLCCDNNGVGLDSLFTYSLYAFPKRLDLLLFWLICTTVRSSLAESKITKCYGMSMKYYSDPWRGIKLTRY